MIHSTYSSISLLFLQIHFHLLSLNSSLSSFSIHEILPVSSTYKLKLLFSVVSDILLFAKFSDQLSVLVTSLQCFSHLSVFYQSTLWLVPSCPHPSTQYRSQISLPASKTFRVFETQASFFPLFIGSMEFIYFLILSTIAVNIHIKSLLSPSPINPTV